MIIKVKAGYFLLSQVSLFQLMLGKVISVQVSSDQVCSCYVWLGQFVSG
jgi:hypothetical protein